MFGPAEEALQALMAQHCYCQPMKADGRCSNTSEPRHMETSRAEKFFTPFYLILLNQDLSCWLQKRTGCSIISCSCSHKSCNIQQTTWLQSRKRLDRLVLGGAVDTGQSRDGQGKLLDVHLLPDIQQLAAFLSPDKQAAGRKRLF